MKRTDAGFVHSMISKTGRAIAFAFFLSSASVLFRTDACAQEAVVSEKVITQLATLEKLISETLVTLDNIQSRQAEIRDQIKSLKIWINRHR